MLYKYIEFKLINDLTIDKYKSRKNTTIFIINYPNF